MSSPAPDRPRVLVVDDDADIRAVTELALTAVAGLDVVCAAGGAEAVERARRDAPAAILLDVQMPGLDGTQTLERLRADAATGQIPVVFLTANSGRAERERLLGLGADGVLAKPFDPLTLGADLRAVLGWSA